MLFWDLREDAADPSRKMGYGHSLLLQAHGCSLHLLLCSQPQSKTCLAVRNEPAHFSINIKHVLFGPGSFPGCNETLAMTKSPMAGSDCKIVIEISGTKSTFNWGIQKFLSVNILNSLRHFIPSWDKVNSQSCLDSKKCFSPSL